MCENCEEELVRYIRHFCLLDGGSLLCEVCAEAEGVEIVNCDCEE